ncbi:hypothetical protein J8F10_24450 [Gemmata sp. G18]|uniref:Uncharacterized protein n=1 Tax=Gemmata palustris TaxID=2822762 RepID=A0ABS5BXM4_9BACT|nr:hypothetical protein [Gemmata palustris]MBP3958413.1 hypothetical protein [Gemmata palustris]
MLSRMYDSFIAVAGIILGLVLLARLGWAAIHGFEPANDFDRARVADGTYWPGITFFLGSLLFAIVVVARIAFIQWRLHRKLKQMDREFYLKNGIPPQTPQRKRRDRP